MAELYVFVNKVYKIFLHHFWDNDIYDSLKPGAGTGIY